MRNLQKMATQSLESQKQSGPWRKIELLVNSHLKPRSSSLKKSQIFLQNKRASIEFSYKSFSRKLKYLMCNCSWLHVVITVSFYALETS